ncbi:MAG: trans-aconitate 2-methyltransferase [Pseudomonadota bacterium]
MSSPSGNGGSKPDWQPALYKRFSGERERPALDLIARIPLERPGFLCDIGCGAGNVTALLEARWPETRILGMDSSPAMLAAARKALPDIGFVLGDAANWCPPEPADLLFANAVFNWLPDHGRLLPRLTDTLKPGGVLAVQMPRNHDRPSHRLMIETAMSGPWRARLASLVDAAPPVAEPAVYARILGSLTRTLDIWETDYLMRLEGENPVVTWMQATALRPFLEPLDDTERAAFLADYAARIRAVYPPEADGRTLFSFRRLFIVATRP